MGFPEFVIVIASIMALNPIAMDMMLPALPGIGQTINGARLWVKVGAFQFQPGELAKIFLIIFLAGGQIVGSFANTVIDLLLGL